MQCFPFRMTAENLAKHRLDPNIAFWRELKKGADYFEVTKMRDARRRLQQALRLRRKAKAGASFDAESACPPLDVDKEVLRAVADKEAQDDSEVQGLIAKGVKPIRIVYQDGGQNPSLRASLRRGQPARRHRGARRPRSCSTTARRPSPSRCRSQRPGGRSATG